jgi:hypothetical protein
VRTQGVYLPAGMVTSGWGIPPVCVRHGRPAAAHRKISFVSRSPWWTFLLILLSVLVALLVMLALRKRVTAPSWPVCDECLRQRRTRLTTMAGLLVGGPVVASLALPVVSSPDSDMTLLVALTGWLVVPLVGLVVGSNAAWAQVLAANVDPTGESVHFRQPAPAFTQLLPGMAPPVPVAPGFPPPPPPSPSSWAGGPTILPGG